MAALITSFQRRPDVDPKIYAYSVNDPEYEGLLKIGYTTKDVNQRVKQQFNIKDAGKSLFKIEYEDTAIRVDGSAFSDKDVHKYLIGSGIANRNNSEWFECSVEDLRAALIAIKQGVENAERRTESFGLRPEQRLAVERTRNYFSSASYELTGRTPHFLWNAKMRFGKTFAVYKLAQEMGWKRLLVLTFKPAVQSAWEDDLNSHIDFAGWKFVSKKDFLNKAVLDTDSPIVCFGSFQDFLGKNEAGGIKAKNEWVHTINWDCVVLDEYHYGAWRERAKDLFESEDKAENDGGAEALDYYDESVMPITTNSYLYLSGTPFKAIARGEFIEEQIFNWTYSDEQEAKNNWKENDNPYASLPRMVLLTYQLPESVQRVALKGQYDEFDLNTFFSAYGEKNNSKFKYESEVQKWLNLIRGAYDETAVVSLNVNNSKPAWPFANVDFLEILSHTFWFLPSVSACYAMKNLLEKPQNLFFKDYRIKVVAGVEAGIGVQAIGPVKEAMSNPLKSKTITLSCGKLITGVSIPPWSGILMLRNTSSPETYFQAAFRVQTPWVIKDSESRSDTILKNECYVFDFAPTRALRQIADYSCRLNIDETSPEQKVEKFIEFLPVLAFDGGAMKQIDAAGILDIAMSGTTATLLARKWEDSNLVNLDLETLQRLIDSPKAIEALMKIEGFRNINKDIEVIINSTNTIKQIKKLANESPLDAEEKFKLKSEDKERKNLKKQIQDKLIKFVTRIPVFMYLTDYREETLTDVINELEPDLFYKVTGLTKVEFQLLNGLGLFNSQLMDDAIYKFKRYEDASLDYSGMKRSSDKVGLWETVATVNKLEKS